MKDDQRFPRMGVLDLASVSLPRISPSEERANVITHAFGLACGIVSVGWLLWQSWAVSTWAQWAGLLIFGLSMLLVYTISTTYHAVRRPGQKRFFRVMDHIAIYFLIAGTHTPFLVYYFEGPWGRFYLILMWSLVAVGILYKLFFFGRWEWLSLALYLGMGWMGALTIPSMWHQLSNASIYGLVAGGLLYTTGVLFYAWSRLPYNHAIWHLFVMGGTAGHFLAVCFMALS